jgi:hypothetical protein
MPYSVDFRWAGGPEAVSKAEFDRLRGFKRIFELRSKGKRLRIYPEYLAWRTADGGLQFQEKLSKRIVGSLRSPEDSVVRTERRCAAHDYRYIRDDAERTKEIERQYW